MGRPSNYRAEYAEQARKLCLLGATDKELASFFEVTEASINNWKTAHPEFMEALRRGKTVADANVAERLYQRAMGYSHEAVKIFMPAGASEPVYAAYTERFPADTQAASLWLRNRQPAKWRDKQEHGIEHSGSLAEPFAVNVMIESAEAAATRLEEAAKRRAAASGSPANG